MQDDTDQDNLTAARPIAVIAVVAFGFLVAYGIFEELKASGFF